MSKTSRLPARHGEDHNPDGYDPIPALSDAIRYEVLNDDGSLDIIASGEGLIETDDSVHIRANVAGGLGGDLTLSAENIATLEADNEVQLLAPTIVVTATTSPLIIAVNGTTFSFQDDGNIVVT